MDSGMVVSEAAPEVKNEIRNEEERLLVAAPDSEVKEIAVLTEFKKKRNQIQVSNVKKPFFYYYNLSKRHIKQYNEVELSALGMAIPTVVTIAEILKRNGLAFQKKLMISSVSLKNGENGKLVMKPKIEIALVNAEKIKNISTAPTSEDS
ncbi:uncharacterized protein At2g34160 [Cucumis sativus]|uniref:DNA/RNA-binding protein Alba-like domain-containing protein n=1 Tax=Cucumis sativus TaxID=3659 RepID=A0A0A0L8F8_CUCSA|nr:uncharacterized protein At2g34160 [Cucumis sativus]KGN56907.1 hypothetical protein Csa_011451 [Cucumis sativus]